MDRNHVQVEQGRPDERWRPAWSPQPGDQLIHQALDQERAWSAEDADEDILAGSTVVSAGIARQAVHDRPVDQVDDLVRPAEVRSQGGVTGEVQGAVVVLDLADVGRLGVDGSACQDLLDLGRIRSLCKRLLAANAWALCIVWPAGGVISVAAPRGGTHRPTPRRQVADPASAVREGRP